MKKMQTGKQISVIIPCYNVELYLRRCVESVLCQDIGRENLEIILVDDASTDNTWELICEYEKTYPETIVGIHLTENMRQGGARNAGLRVANGLYIAFVDSDDWIEPDMYRRMYEKSILYNCDIVFCRNVRDDGTIANFKKHTGGKDCFLVIDTAKKRSEFIATNLIGVGVWDKLYKRDIIFNNKIHFLEKMAYEDIHWGALFYLYAKRVYILEEVLYHYFINNQSTVLKRNQKYHFDFFRVNLKKLEEFEKRGAWMQYKDAVEYDFLLTYYIAGIKLLAHRFDKIPYDIFYEMQNTVRVLVPDYKENIFVIRDAKEIYKLLFELVEKSLSERDIDEILETVRKLKL